MKVAELEGALLDYWVAKAEGFTNTFETFKASPTPYSSSQEFGGIIIEREKITCVWLGYHWTAGFQFEALSNYPWWHMTWMRDGDSQVQAAMRSYVFKRFGEEVEDAPHNAG